MLKIVELILLCDLACFAVDAIYFAIDVENEKKQYKKVCYLWLENSFDKYQRMIIKLGAWSWNLTGLVKFKFTNNMSDAKIRLYKYCDSNDIAVATTTHCDAWKQSYYISFNQVYFHKGVGFRVLVGNVEHELGHAIGLQHVIGRHSVMNPVAEGDLINPADVKLLKRTLADPNTYSILAK